MLWILGLLIGRVGAAQPQKTPESPPSVAFPGHPGHALVRAGTAVRERFGTAFYQSSLYVDLEALRRKLPHGAWPSTARIAAALCTGDVPILFHTRFLQDASGPANLRFLHAALSRHWPSGTFDAAAPELQAFNAFFGESISQGLVDEVALDGRGGLLLRRTGKEVRVQHPPLALAFLRMYFEDPPLDVQMRDSLLLELPARLDARKSGL